MLVHVLVFWQVSSSLLCLVWLWFGLVCLFETVSLYVDQASLKFTVLLPQPSEFWDWRFAPPCPDFCVLPESRDLLGEWPQPLNLSLRGFPAVQLACQMGPHVLKVFYLMPSCWRLPFGLPLICCPVYNLCILQSPAQLGCLQSVLWESIFI